MTLGNSSHSYIGALDGLRFFAALIVFIGHFSNQTGFLGKRLGGGAEEIGVVLFFLLSGFLMGKLYLPRQISSKAVKEFFVARFARIYPLFVLVVVASYFSETLFPGVVRLYDISLIDVVSNLVLLDGTHVMWTIVVECWFYLLVPLLWAVFRLNLWVFLAIQFATFGFWFLGGIETDPENKHSLIRFLHVFSIGLTLGALDEKISAKLQRVKGSPAFDVLFVLFVVSLLVLYPGIVTLFGFAKQQPYESVHILIASTALLFLTTRSPLAMFILGWRGFRYLGTISFGIYLFHMPVIWNVLPGLSSFPTVVALVICLTIVVLVAAMSFYVFERPARRRLRFALA